MFTRATGWLIVPAWLAAMGWLVAHDVWPGLSAPDAPPLCASDWVSELDTRSQYTLFDDGGRIGTIWTEYHVDAAAITRSDVVAMERFHLDIAPLRMIVDSAYTGEGMLDEFTLKLENAASELRLHGERFESAFSFVLTTGPMERFFKVPLTDGRLITGGFNPLGRLTDLHIGQRWRMQVFNPIAALTGFGERFIPVVATVTGEEILSLESGPTCCRIVETPNAKAWVDQRGTVQVQEITLPVVGRMRMRREAVFDDAARRAATQGREFLQRGADL